MELLTFIASLFIIALWILWIILPFAIFRIRKESIRQTKEQIAQTDLLQEIATNTKILINK